MYLQIDEDDQVEIKDAADQVWGHGHPRHHRGALAHQRGQPTSCVATIGPAGENLLPYAVHDELPQPLRRRWSLGAVMGSKKLKALVVEGNGSVNVKDPKALADLSDYMLREIVGSNNNHVVPSTQQEWAEYYDKGTRWTARKGLYWADAEGEPIETGEPKPGEINTVGYRCMKASKDEGPRGREVHHQDGRLPQLPDPLLLRLARAERLGGQRRLRDHGQHLRAELPVLRLHGEDPGRATPPSKASAARTA